ncbi:MAG: hypothetical protein HC799_20145, partial [Limnothrix sp. RL_2_0]|nr:hypothetical protein [Limnothrix sp. RL_2_0]
MRNILLNSFAGFSTSQNHKSTPHLHIFTLTKKKLKKEYQIILQDMQLLARSLLIFGMHIHVGIENREVQIQLMNEMRYFMPHILAISTNSPSTWRATRMYPRPWDSSAPSSSNRGWTRRRRRECSGAAARCGSGSRRTATG